MQDAQTLVWAKEVYMRDINAIIECTLRGIRLVFVAPFGVLAYISVMNKLDFQGWRFDLLVWLFVPWFAAVVLLELKGFIDSCSLRNRRKSSS